MAAKRAGRARYGSGSITERGPNRHQIRVNAGSDPQTGKRRVITETVVGTKDDAQRRLEQIQRDVRHAPSATAATVNELAAEWRDHLQVAPQTRSGYELSLDRDLLPRLGAHRLDRLTTLDVQRAYSAMGKAGVKVHAIRRAHAVLSKMLNDACRWGWVGRNVAEHAVVPAAPPSQTAAVDAGTVGKLVTAADQAGPLVALWLHLHLVTGARRQEVLALRWCDVDLVGDGVNAGFATFAQVLERRDGKIAARAGTKTGKPKRVPLGARTVALLTDRLAACVAELDGAPPPTGYIISAAPDGGRPWRPDYASHLFKKLCAAAKVTGVRLHDLRHTAISHIIAETGDVLLASRMAGHSRTATTTEVYGHVLAGQLRTATDVLGRLADGEH